MDGLTRDEWRGSTVEFLEEERFLRNGSFDKSELCVFWEAAGLLIVDEGVKEGTVGTWPSWAAAWESDSVVSIPLPDSIGPLVLLMSLGFMSPKYCSVSLTASPWGTPANATTIRSGLKKSSLYRSTTALLISPNRSSGHNSGFPRVLSA